GRVAGWQAVRCHRQLQHRVVDRGGARHLRRAGQPAGARNADCARRAAGGLRSLMAWFTRRRAPIVWGLVAVLVLAGVFMAYLNPHLMVDLANRIWACF